MPIVLHPTLLYNRQLEWLSVYLRPSQRRLPTTTLKRAQFSPPLHTAIKGHHRFVSELNIFIKYRHKKSKLIAPKTMRLQFTFDAFAPSKPILSFMRMQFIFFSMLLPFFDDLPFQCHSFCFVLFRFIQSSPLFVWETIRAGVVVNGRGRDVESDFIHDHWTRLRILTLGIGTYLRPPEVGTIVVDLKLVQLKRHLRRLVLRWVLMLYHERCKKMYLNRTTTSSSIFIH